MSIIKNRVKKNLRLHELFCINEIYVGGLISFASTVIFLFTLDISEKKNVSV